jgi:hypothetical protein
MRARVLILLVVGALLGTALPVYAIDDDQWTVLTLASDGAWGTASDFYIGHAIAFAIRNCRAMSKRPIGCGADFIATRAGWGVGGVVWQRNDHRRKKATRRRGARRGGSRNRTQAGLPPGNAAMRPRRDRRSQRVRRAAFSSRQRAERDYQHAIALNPQYLNSPQANMLRAAAPQ